MRRSLAALVDKPVMSILTRLHSELVGALILYTTAMYVH